MEKLMRSTMFIALFVTLVRGMITKGRLFRIRNTA